jgi:HK97 family phage portal protein
MNRGEVPVKVTPVTPGIIRRVAQGVKYLVTGNPPEAWFGPLTPLEPIAPPEVKGRAWDYPVGVNTQYRPRSEEGVSFDMMRSLADNYDLLRIVIETRKDQLVRMDWRIRPKDGKDGNQSHIDEVERLLAYPDRKRSWQQWLRILLEEMLVIDATTIYPRRALGGQVYSLDIVDGSTIKILVEQDGRQPDPPGFAYQQILKGIVAAEFTMDELLYTPRNPRANKFYGFSPVEQIIMTVNIGLRRQMFTLNYYTDGNMPESLIGVPPDWQPDQIRQFQEYWDSLLAGNLGERRRAKFIPGGMTPHMVKESLLKDEMDEWLARVVCFAFSISPAPFVKMMNRATSETVQEAALNEGLIPLLRWVKDLIDQIIERQFGYPDLEFEWKMEEEADLLVKAQVHDIYVRNGVLSVDEVREELGLEPVGMDNAVYGAQGVTLLEEIINPPEPEPVPMALLPTAGEAPKEKDGDEEPGKEPDDPEAQKAFLASTINKAYRLGLL